MHASDWASITSAAVAAIAVILSFFSYRRTLDVRRQEIQDRRTAQARQVTGWWTRVKEDTLEDLTLGNSSGPEWPTEAGFRIWISNNSDDAAYECVVFAPIT